MIILVGSKIDQASIQGSLGKPEYSYFFLMKDFLPALERLGTVLPVKSTEEIERLTEQYRALMATEGVTLEFRDDGVKRIAEIAFAVAAAMQVHQQHGEALLGKGLGGQRGAAVGCRLQQCHGLPQQLPAGWAPKTRACP